MLLDIVTKGSVDRSVVLRIIDSTDGTPETGVVFNTAGIDLWYRREGAAVTSITEATLAALTTAHTDGGFLAVSHGYYRLDLPDAAVATGANYVDVGGTVTGMVVIGGRVRLTDFNLESASTPQTGDSFARIGAPAGASVSADVAAVKVDTAAILVDTGTTLDGRIPAALVGGRIDASVGAVAANAITAAAVADGAIDRATFAADTGLQSIRSNTAQAGAATTITLDASASAVTDFYKNALIVLTGGTGVGQGRFCTAYNGTTKVATVSAWATAPDVTSTFAILAFDAIIGATAPTAVEVANEVQTRTIAAVTTVNGLAAGTVTATAIAAAALNGKGDWNIGKTGYTLSAAGIQAVWDALTSALTTVGSIGKLLVDNINATISSRLASASYTAPLDAAGTRAAVGLASANLDTQLVTIDDFLDTEVAAILAAVDTEVAAIKTKTDNLPEGISKNTALSNFTFLMVDSTDHVTGKTGLTVTAERRIDAGVFAACANAPTEVAGGVYSINLAATDLNGDVVTLKFTSAGADATVISIKTEAA